MHGVTSASPVNLYILICIMKTSFSFIAVNHLGLSAFVIKLLRIRTPNRAQFTTKHAKSKSICTIYRCTCTAVNHQGRIDYVLCIIQPQITQNRTLLPIYFNYNVDSLINSHHGSDVILHFTTFQ